VDTEDVVEAHRRLLLQQQQKYIRNESMMKHLQTANSQFKFSLHFYPVFLKENLVAQRYHCMTAARFPLHAARIKKN
jgi:hypothetical protein